MIHDVIIIGGGPCGLAVAARLCESSPSALFTDQEHARHWGRYKGQNTVQKESKRQRSNRIGFDTGAQSKLSILVLDAHSDQWMSSWKSRFEKLNISHLRSPLFFHPDPRDRDGLLAFCHSEERTGELHEIHGVVGREISKHGLKKRHKRRNIRREPARHLHLDNRDQNDYFTPTSSLFECYIDSIVQRYNLSDMIHQAEVVDISYDYTDHSPTKLFALTISKEEVYMSRTVIIATGPSVPWLRLPDAPYAALNDQKGSISHIFSDPTGPVLPPQVLSAIQPRHQYRHLQPSRCPFVKIVIVGGGLTSAQVTDLLLATYPPVQVHLVIRSKRLKVKHFDVDLCWVSKLRNRKMATFWSADTDEERFELLKDARGGGSITPKYEKILRKWQDSGRLVLHEGSELAQGTTGGEGSQDGDDETTKWDACARVWNVVLKPSPVSLSSTSQPIQTYGSPSDPDYKISSNPVSIHIPQVSHILLATTNPPNIHFFPFLQTLHKLYPIPTIKGLPILTEDLTWHEDVPMFVTGALAGLRLGPGAGNLAGARLGAERIAWGLESVLGKHSNGNGRVDESGGVFDTGLDVGSIRILERNNDDDDHDDEKKTNASNESHHYYHDTGNSSRQEPTHRHDHLIYESDPFRHQSHHHHHTTTSKTTTLATSTNLADLADEYKSGIGNQFECLSLISA